MAKWAYVPIAIGFGISTPEQAERCLKISDGVIVGSATVRIIGRYGAEAGPAPRDYMEQMIKACSQGLPT